MNRYTIKNNKFQFSVYQEGAELHSFKSLKSKKEYIWKADPEVWGSHAPNLFPIIGCLKEDSFLYKGKEYACPKHGFIRKNNAISLINETDNSLTFGLKYSEETLAVYPFKFEFQIKYTLIDNKLEVAHTIINHGDEQMLFSLGGHPGFTCPLNEGEEYTDYYLEFEKPETAETWRVLESGLIGKDTSPVFDEPTKINLHPQLFKDDALVFKNLNSSKVSLKSKKSDQVLSVEFKDFPYLGIWAKTNAPYVCIEPWLGIADSFNADRNLENKEAIMKLEANKDFVAVYSIIIKE
ncbi:MAG: aldose 1-epimerase family protein [Flavobacteriaceae bacterium]|nr:aldose 1-epimerase family protein [Flavobacteriaceae bacterium]